MFSVAIIFILVLGLLIFVHELGHFIAAKRAGIKVEEFGMGFPPRIFGFKKGETLYSLNLLPIGGFVKIYGEDELNKEEKDSNQADQKRAFFNQPISTRAKVLSAGVAMNFFLAMFLLIVGYGVGLPQAVEEGESANFRNSQIQVVEVAMDSPAQKAGIKIGDTVKGAEAGGVSFSFSNINEVQEFIDQRQGETILLAIQRGENMIEREIVPRDKHPENEGPLGIAMARTALVSYPWYEAIYRGIASSFYLLTAIVLGIGQIFWNLISSGETPDQIAGPVGIFNLAAQATELGYIYVLQLTVVLSINLAILNILPLPALDGGRLLFLAIEKIKGSPLSRKAERIAHAAGFVFLILLMLAITWQDIARIL